jgi:hypothetical protein
MVGGKNKRAGLTQTDRCLLLAPTCTQEALRNSTAVPQSKSGESENHEMIHGSWSAVIQLARLRQQEQPRRSSAVKTFFRNNGLDGRGGKDSRRVLDSRSYIDSRRGLDAEEMHRRQARSRRRIARATRRR